MPWLSPAMVNIANENHQKRSYKGRRRSIRGYGDYSGGGSTFSQGTSPPQVRNSKGGFIVRHREYIQDIQSSQAFVGVAGYINPGNSALFPWLSQVALNFEEWVPRGDLRVLNFVSQLY